MENDLRSREATKMPGARAKLLKGWIIWHLGIFGFTDGKTSVSACWIIEDARMPRCLEE